MKLVIFGLTVSSSWGNGHATIWRGLLRALIRRGHDIVFFEHDVPYYAVHRDLNEISGGTLELYSEWNDIRPTAERHLAEADVALVTSYCPDGVIATELVLNSAAAVRTFYDLDTPVTLAEIRAGRGVSYIGPRGLQDFDLVFSYTGGRALDALREELGARMVVPLYGSVDPEMHRPVMTVEDYRADLSYLGTFAQDRQEALERLFIEPARQMPHLRFLIGGAQYPQEFPWIENIHFVRHVPPSLHPAFYCSSRITLNVTRGTMAEMGYCPSGRLFEAAACGAPIVSDWWEGLDEFFTPYEEIIVAHSSEHAVRALGSSDEQLKRIAAAARERALSEHTAEQRAAAFEAAVEHAPAGTT